MQSIAGIHYNFSLPDVFWPICQSLWGSEGDLQAFKSERYFGMTPATLSPPKPTQYPAQTTRPVMRLKLADADCSRLEARTDFLQQYQHLLTQGMHFRFVDQLQHR